MACKRPFARSVSVISVTLDKPSLELWCLPCLAHGENEKSLPFLGRCHLWGSARYLSSPQHPAVTQQPEEKVVSPCWDASRGHTARAAGPMVKGQGHIWLSLRMQGSRAAVLGPVKLRTQLRGPLPWSPSLPTDLMWTSPFSLSLLAPCLLPSWMEMYLFTACFNHWRVSSLCIPAPCAPGTVGPSYL